MPGFRASYGREKLGQVDVFFLGFFHFFSFVCIGRFDLANASGTADKVICGEIGSALGAKVPSVLLLRNNATLDLLGFGDDAEAQFKEADAEGKLSEVLYISGFKLEMYKLNVSTDVKKLVLRPMNNNEVQVPLDLIVQRCFEAISQHALKRLAQIQKSITVDRISWIVSTPAIWSQSAVQFMRQAVEKAKIPGSCIRFVMEPEAAAIQCREALKKKLGLQQPQSQQQQAQSQPQSQQQPKFSGPTPGGSAGAPALASLHINASDQKLYPIHALNAALANTGAPNSPQGAASSNTVQNAKGKRVFLVGDLGGGTADYTVHEIIDETKDEVAEICPASGGVWGSTIVTTCFLEFMKRLMGPKVLEAFRLQHPVAYLDLIKNYEAIKDRIDPDRTSATGYSSIRLPGPLMDIFKEIVKALPHKVQGPLGVEIPFADRYPTVQLSSAVQLQSERQSHQQNVAELMQSNLPTTAAIPLNEPSDSPATAAAAGAATASATASATATSVAAAAGTAEANVVLPCTVMMGEAILTAPEIQDDTHVPMSDTWFKGDLLKIHNNTMKHFFHNSVNMIAEYIDNKCEAYSGMLQTVFLVGGYAASPMVQSAVEKVVKKYPGITLVIPPHPGECVLTGAVLYGLRPEQIRGRIASHHYLVSTMSPWDEKLHSKWPLATKLVLPKTKILSGGKQFVTSTAYCSNNAFLLCPKGQLIPADHKGFSKTLYAPSDSKEHSMVQLLFGRSSAEKPPLVFNDPSVSLIGKIHLRCDTKTSQQQKLSLQVFLGDREMRVMAENETTKDMVHATISALDKEAPNLQIHTL